MYYGSVEDFKSYHQDRGRDIPAEWTDSMIQSTLLVATEWLDAGFRNLWVGYPKDGFVQQLQWPRREAYITNQYEDYLIPDNVIPYQVENATYEAAFKELTTPNSLNIDLAPNLYKVVSVDGAVRVEYDKSIISTSDAQNQFVVVQKLMSQLVSRSRALSSPLSGGAFRT